MHAEMIKTPRAPRPFVRPASTNTHNHPTTTPTTKPTQQDAQGRPYKGIADAFRRICAEEGAATLMSGVGPRVMWIGIGGFVFFGVYEDARRLLTTRVGI